MTNGHRGAFSRTKGETLFGGAITLSGASSYPEVSPCRGRVGPQKALDGWEGPGVTGDTAETNPRDQGAATTGIAWKRRIGWRASSRLPTVLLLVAVAGVGVGGCGSLPTASTPTPSAAISSGFSSTTPEPTPLPAQSTPIPETLLPTPTPRPTLDATAAGDLTQIASLASAVYAEQEDVRDQCDILDGTSEANQCQAVLNQASGYASGLPQAINAFVSSYNLSTDLTAWEDNVQQDVSDVQAGIDAELSGLQDRSSSSVLSASNQVEAAAGEITSAVSQMQDSVP